MEDASGTPNAESAGDCGWSSRKRISLRGSKTTTDPGAHRLALATECIAEYRRERQDLRDTRGANSDDRAVLDVIDEYKFRCKIYDLAVSALYTLRRA